MITERPRASAAPLLRRGRHPERQPGTGPKWEPAHGSLSVGGIQDRPTSGVNAITPRKLYACTAPRTRPADAAGQTSPRRRQAGFQTRRWGRRLVLTTWRIRLGPATASTSLEVPSCKPHEIDEISCAAPNHKQRS